MYGTLKLIIFGKRLNRLNEDSTDNTIGYNYDFKKI